MSNDKNKKGKKEISKSNIVQFPQMDADPGDLLDDLYEEMMPDLLDFYLPAAVEFASVTAVEIMKYSDEARRQVESGALANENLHIIYIKMRGLSITVPSVDLLSLLDEMGEMDLEEEEGMPDLLYLHDIIDDSIDGLEDLMDVCADYYEDHGNEIGPIPGEYLKEHDAAYVFEDVRDCAEEVLMELSDFAARMFEWNEEE